MQTLQNDGPGAQGGGLTAADFTRIAANGFGDPQNAYCHSMAAFGDHVYVGTTRHSMALLKLFPPAEPPVLEPWPVRVPQRVQELDMRGQIWRWSLKDERWEQVYHSPLIQGKEDEEVPRDLGYRGMAVFQGKSDPAPALYVGTMSTVLRGTAAHILRSDDGVTFTAVSEPGLGNPQISTFRSLHSFDGHLYVPPTGEGIQFNSNRASVVMRSADPGVGRWEQACPAGFGDPTNTGIFECVVFNDHLYAGTFNCFEGYQVWKTPATGSAPNRWTRVVERGAYRGELNEIAMSLCVFDGALYVGSAIQNGGYDRVNRVGPAAGEIIRIHPDDSWDLVVGEPRDTPAGKKHPISGMGPGFDNLFAGYIWRMAAHDGWLYVSTFDWSVFLPWAGRPSLQAKRLVNQVGMDQIIQHGGGFDLWRTRDGVNWIPVTRDGMGNPYNYGARNFVSTPHGLFVGTANPFGPEVAARTADGWIYTPNPSGGAEVWLGRPAAREVPAGRPSASVRRGGRRRDDEARVLVTGATGFIGRHVLERLLRREERVRVFALPETVGDIDHPEPDRIEVVTGSLGERARLEEAMGGVETVYHLAGMLPGAPWEQLIEVNVNGTENVLHACARTRGLRRLLFTSSASVYAGLRMPQTWPLTETSYLWPRTPGELQDYGRSKVLAEKVVQWHAEQGGFEAVILRPSTTYGIGGAFVRDLVEYVLAHPLAMLGRRGPSLLQLLHVRDLAELVVRAGTEPAAAGQIYNASGAESMSPHTFATMVRRLAGEDEGMEEVLPLRERLWERYRLVLDIRKARRELGFLPRMALQEGLAEVVAARDGSASPGRRPPGRERVSRGGRGVRTRGRRG